MISAQTMLCQLFKIYLSISDLVRSSHACSKRADLVLLMLTNCWLNLTSQICSSVPIVSSTHIRYTIGTAMETEKVTLVQLS